MDKLQELGLKIGDSVTATCDDIIWDDGKIEGVVWLRPLADEFIIKCDDGGYVPLEDCRNVELVSEEASK